MTLYLTLPTSGNFCHLPITFANSFDADQARRNVGPDLDPNCLTMFNGIEKYGTIINLK